MKLQLTVSKHIRRRSEMPAAPFPRNYFFAFEPIATKHTVKNGAALFKDFSRIVDHRPSPAAAIRAHPNQGCTAHSRSQSWLAPSEAAPCRLSAIPIAPTLHGPAV